MKLFKNKFLILIIVITFLTSCTISGTNKNTTTINTNGTKVIETTTVPDSDTAKYILGNSVHIEQENKRISKMVKSVMDSNSCVDCTGEAKAWSEAFKVQSIAYGTNFKPTDYKVKAPTNGYDVITSVVGEGVSLLKTGAMVYGGVELGKAVVGSMGTEVTMGGNNIIDDSFTSELNEAHATTFGEGGEPTTSLDNSKPIEDNNIKPLM